MELRSFETKYDEYKQALFKTCMIHLKNNNDVQDVLMIRLNLLMKNIKRGG